MSFQVPEDAQPGDEILFPALQVYSSGEEVNWVDPDPEAETPAPRIVVVAPEEEEAAGQPRDRTPREEAQAAAAASSDDDDDSSSTMALVFGIAGLAAGLLALGVALFRKPKGTTA